METDKIMENLQERIKAVMLGHAVGDALGVPVEFCSREELKKNPVTDMTGYGTYPVPAGSWSDDTSMSIAALDSLADGRVDYDAVMENFVKWFALDAYTPTGDAFDMGNTCVQAIRNRLNHRDRPATECGCGEESANGNGSLMRIHPFVLYAYAHRMPYGEWSEMIRAASALTHAHERSWLGCLIYAFLLLRLLEDPHKQAIGAALTEAIAYVGNYPEIAHYERLFHPRFAKMRQTKIKSSGYVVDTLEAAVWCVLTTDSYRECVLKAVNLGEDTDTVAAIAGGLAGALYGYDAIPRDWMDALIKRPYIEEMCERAGKTWTSSVLFKGRIDKI